MDIEDPKINLLNTCRELGVAVVAYSPLGRGFLTGRIRSPDDFEDGDFRIIAPRFSRENFHKNLRLVDTLKALADAAGCTTSQLVLAFLLAQGEDIFPIPGTTRVENFNENIGAFDVKFSEDDDSKIREAISMTEVSGARCPEEYAEALFASTVPLKV